MKCVLLTLALVFPLYSHADVLTAVSNAVQILDLDQRAINTNAVEVAVIEGIAQTIDAGARVISSNELVRMNDMRKGMVYQTGARLSMSNGFPKIIGIASNSPAERAGLKIGDSLTSIRGNDTHFSTIAAVSKMLRSESHESIRVVANETNELELALEQLQLPNVECAEEWPENLVYLHVNGIFSSDQAVQIAAWNRKSGLVLDLRGAGGHNAPLAQTMSAACISAGYPIVALVDGETSGAAEILAAFLSGEASNTLIVGETTAGDPLLRKPIALPSGEFLYYAATQRLAAADGSIYDGHDGVVPDIVVKSDTLVSPYEAGPDELDHREKLEEESEDRTLRNRLAGDTALARAVDILLGLKALDIHGQVSSDNPAR